VIFTAATSIGEGFSVSSASHLSDIAAALSLSPEELEAVDGETDLRTGTLLEIPLPASNEFQTARGRIVELSDKPHAELTDSELKEFVNAVGKLSL
tara:strand:+ start:1239 stop:1526 length:288 start_codon:yes stop_codon:yes gene_type:complete